MSQSLLASSRIWHRRIASLLFIFFCLIGLTGLMLGWKAMFTNVIFDKRNVRAETALKKWLPLDSLEKLAVSSLNERTKGHFLHAENVLLKPSKGYINFSFEDYYNIQVDGGTGTAIHIEQKNGGWIQDIHDGAILDGLFASKSGVSKKAYTSIMALSLLFLAISGFYLWYKPRRIKQSKIRI
ncbi:MAG: PepSY-associated TM helix domain-containing protein [Bacteroidota bacterium]|nr:PepSY-associated TM helix domain-containing protein [Bacteroidota bacterium]MDP4215649.1 PepSY-associated TM helix domain-containing protein [Bacteroidota bacterium]MDP4246528.1 PepSY-associated TM helix domain-containing protein [Bacteroidota bacterium]MDP4252915.1 PepSY-associated TM helix domain-containing protein [Bacteroidota bacterium]MDP4259763.1 PepSY-associated TM helix domain-containing protein [Bacteroidota bacterium]